MWVVKLKLFIYFLKPAFPPLETQLSIEFEPWTLEPDHLTKPALSLIRSMTLTSLISLRFLICKMQNSNLLCRIAAQKVSIYTPGTASTA